jgi:hypothetical protein
MFRTAYYRLILLPTFESADIVAKVKQKTGSETALWEFFLRALRDTAFLFGDEQDAIAAPLSSNAQ